MAGVHSGGRDEAAQHDRDVPCRAPVAGAPQGLEGLDFSAPRKTRRRPGRRRPRSDDELLPLAGEEPAAAGARGRARARAGRTSAQADLLAIPEGDVALGRPGQGGPAEGLPQAPPVRAHPALRDDGERRLLPEGRRRAPRRLQLRRQLRARRARRRLPVRVPPARAPPDRQRPGGEGRLPEPAAQLPDLPARDGGRHLVARSTARPPGSTGASSTSTSSSRPASGSSGAPRASTAPARMGSGRTSPPTSARGCASTRWSGSRWRRG